MSSTERGIEFEYILGTLSIRVIVLSSGSFDSKC